MKQKTIEGNELLARFMGGKTESTHFEIDMGFIWVPYEGMHRLNALKYHSSFDWLMKVVEKINSLGYIFSIELHPEYERLKSKNYNRVEILHNEDRHIYRDSTISFDKPVIESVWKACVTFVKWYNENNKLESK